MKVLRFEPADAVFERSPGQNADIFAANLADQRQGGRSRWGTDAMEPTRS